MAKLFFYLGVLLAGLISFYLGEDAEKEESKTNITESFKVSETLKDKHLM
jgi:hypothetical protein